MGLHELNQRNLNPDSPVGYPTEPNDERLHLAGGLPAAMPTHAEPPRASAGPGKPPKAGKPPEDEDEGEEQAIDWRRRLANAPGLIAFVQASQAQIDSHLHTLVHTPHPIASPLAMGLHGLRHQLTELTASLDNFKGDKGWPSIMQIESVQERVDWAIGTIRQIEARVWNSSMQRARTPEQLDHLERVLHEYADRVFASLHRPQNEGVLAARRKDVTAMAPVLDRLLARPQELIPWPPATAQPVADSPMGTQGRFSRQAAKLGQAHGIDAAGLVHTLRATFGTGTRHAWNTGMFRAIERIYLDTAQKLQASPPSASEAEGVKQRQEAMHNYLSLMVEMAARGSSWARAELGRDVLGPLTVPQQLDDHLAALLNHLRLDPSQVVVLTHTPPQGFKATPLNAHANVMRQIEIAGQGEIEHGWMLLQNPTRTYSTAVFHSVWKLPDGRRLDITPPPLQDRVLFVPDPHHHAPNLETPHVVAKPGFGAPDVVTTFRFGEPTDFTRRVLPAFPRHGE